MAVLVLAGCSGNGYRGYGSASSAGVLPPVMTGGRLAAVLTTKDQCSLQGGGYTAYPGQTAGNQIKQVYPGQQTKPSQMNSNQYGTSHGGVWGSLQIMALYENELQVVGMGLTDRRASISNVGSGVSGFATSTLVELPGLRTGPHGSQVSYSPDGTTLLVTRTEDSALSLVRAYDMGGLGSHYQISTGSHPTEIAVGRTTWGDMAAVVTDNGVDLVAFDRVAYDGGSVGAPYDTIGYQRQMNQGVPMAATFLPGGRWLAVAVANGASASSATNGRIDYCDMGYYAGETQPPVVSGYQRATNRPIGCAGDPDYGPGFGAYYGISFLSGVPLKLAITDRMAVSISRMMAPEIIAMPEGFSFDAYFEESRPSGSIMRYGIGSQGVNLNARYTDVAVHPYSDNILALTEDGSLVTFPAANAAEYGLSRSRVFAQKGTAMAVDPGPNPEFILVADQASGKVAIGRIRAQSASLNTFSDFAQLSACPIDVTIRGRSAPPVVAAPAVASDS